MRCVSSRVLPRCQCQGGRRVVKVMEPQVPPSWPPGVAGSHQPRRKFDRRRLAALGSREHQPVTTRLGDSVKWSAKAAARLAGG